MISSSESAVGNACSFQRHLLQAGEAQLQDPAGAGVQSWTPCQGWHMPRGSQSQKEGLLEKFLLQMTLKLFMQYPHAFCGYRYHYFIMLSCEV